MIDHGLSDAQLLIIKNIFAEPLIPIEKICLFGSRASGTYKNYSDIDLVLYGDIDEAALDRLWTCLHESALPYKVDLIGYQYIKHPPLKRHIDRCGKILFSEDDLYSRDTDKPTNNHHT